MESPLIYRYAYGGSLGWLLAIITIAALASYLPARKASRLSVRETLAYE
jgi:putative ABC transport system permease protein